ncbi:MAG: hypothetical protein J6X94_04180 [Lachnospiraceae bacterium]|nr:hypothetical protein [Lachnospiraceae bacterium]
MKKRTSIDAKLFVGALFAFIGAVFAVCGILLYFLGDASHVSGSSADPRKNFMMLCGMFIFMGLIFAIVGGSLFVKEFRLVRRKNALMETGRKIFAVVTGVFEDESIRINNRHPYYAVCQYEDPYSGEKQFYDTRSYDTDLTHTIGRTVAVYIDQSNPELYFVDYDPR